MYLEKFWFYIFFYWCYFYIQGGFWIWYKWFSQFPEWLHSEWRNLPRDMDPWNLFSLLMFLHLLVTDLTMYQVNMSLPWWKNICRKKKKNASSVNFSECILSRKYVFQKFVLEICAYETEMVIIYLRLKCDTFSIAMFYTHSCTQLSFLFLITLKIK